MYGSQESVSSCSKSFNRLIIEYAASLLSSSVNGIYAELSMFHTDVYTNPDLDVEDNARILVNLIKAEREAEKAYFKSHPELNP